MSGALTGLRVVEFAGLGPAPFACMMLADMGAEVVTIERFAAHHPDPCNIVGRNRSTVMCDLKDATQITGVLALLRCADVLVEGFRPGVMERLGLGPEALTQENPALIYGRMTGWGQSGPLALAAGHDLNYIALSGALSAIGTEAKPLPPLNLVGDYGGGSLYLISGILAALYERQRSGRGQIVDAAIVDGTLSMMSTHWSHQLRGVASETRADNMLDGGAPYYRAYQTSDASFVSIAAIEPAFFAIFCKAIALPTQLHDAQNDKTRWHQLACAIESIIGAKDLAYWQERLEGTDCCFAPVLSISQARRHPHHQARQAFVNVDGIDHPAPAPRLSRTPSRVRHGATQQAMSLDSVLVRWQKPHA